MSTLNNNGMTDPKKVSGTLSAIKEFLVDFLGCLMPGIFFVFILLISTLITFNYYYVIFYEKKMIKNPTFEETIKTEDTFISDKISRDNEKLTTTNKQNKSYTKEELPKNIFERMEPFNFELVLFFLIFSYIMGSIFFRKDPKKPDQKSATKIYRKEYKAINKLFKNCEDRDDRISEKLSSLAAIPINDIDERKKRVSDEFPYLNIKKYLTTRKLNHLANIITWDKDKEETYKMRSKMFINILKIRIFNFSGEKATDLIKNEAHIRLTSSLWYASFWILILTLFFLIITAFSGFILYFKYDIKYGVFCLYTSLVWNSIFSILMILLRNSINGFFHYQRVREIVYVLEVAYILSKEDPHILNDLT